MLTIKSSGYIRSGLEPVAFRATQALNRRSCQLSHEFAQIGIHVTFAGQRLGNVQDLRLRYIN